MALPIWSGLGAIVCYVIYVAIWRLYFSPIAAFPGPRMAALTSLYDAFYNIWLGGKYTYRIRSMHMKYGQIVRISPTQLHIADPDFFDTLFPSSANGRRVNKVERFFGLDDSLFSTIDHNLHRTRRAALSPFFSTAFTRNLQPMYQERLDILESRMLELKDTDEPLNANCVFAAFTNDIMQGLVFGHHEHKLETPDFDSTERDASLSGAMSYHVLKRFIWFNDVLMATPEPILQVLSNTLYSYTHQKRTTQKKVAELANGPEADLSKDGFVPIIRAALDTPKLPAQEKTVERLSQDAQTLLMAGTLTTASTLEHLTYWLVTNPNVLQKLKEELHGVMPSIHDVGKVPLATLEALPYMTAVIKEGVRLIYGNSNPQFRSSPDEPLHFADKETGRDWMIPAGTPVGMSCVLLHHNEANFPNSYHYDPERWLGAKGKKLDKYLVSFGKGTRICLGMNQAYGIMRLALAQIWRVWATTDARIGDEAGILSLYNTTPHDVEMAGDFFIPSYNKHRGVEFKLRSLDMAS